MSKTIIIYKSVYGSTRKYAEWLSKDLKCKTLEMDNAGNKEVRNYDTIIVMSGTYAMTMPLTNYLKNNWAMLENKK